MQGKREISYDVRVYKVMKTARASVTTYRLRWAVAGRRWSRTYATAALADSKRSELLAAARRGEAFDIETGWPVSTGPSRDSGTWWEATLRFVRTKWPELAPMSRRSMAEALTTATMAVLDDVSGPSAAALRAAMFAWAFNAVRQAGPPTGEHVEAIQWLERHTPRLVDVGEPEVLRQVLEAVTRKLDGTTAAPTTLARKRAVIYQLFEHAVEQGAFETNPLGRLRWKQPKVADTFDPRSVINPTQARSLLAALANSSRDTGKIDIPSGDDQVGPGAAGHCEADRPSRRTVADAAANHRLMAFFALQYYGALRPSEAMALQASDVVLPAVSEGSGAWGELRLSRSNPEISGRWNDDGRRKPRQLKHRAIGVVRTVPCPPDLVAILRCHLEDPGPSEDGRLFYGSFGGTITAHAYNEAWDRARRAVLTDHEYRSPLAARPYDLSHTAVSGWLAAGVDSALVAAWAGHSVAVLHRVYAHVVLGRQDEARRRVTDFLGGEQR
jgi:integrase